MTTVALRTVTMTLVAGEPLYCPRCRPSLTTLGAVTPVGFRAYATKHLYTYRADGVVDIICGDCHKPSTVTVTATGACVV